MAKDKTTITVDRAKVEEVRRLTGAASTSAAVDLALAELIRKERIRRDVDAYRTNPPSEAEAALAAVNPNWADLADDTDWDALYRDEQ